MSLLKIREVLGQYLLEGDGIISVRGDEGLLEMLWNADQPFAEELLVGDESERILPIDLEADADQEIRFGDANSLALVVHPKASVGVSLDIIGIGEDLSVLEPYGLGQLLDEDHIYVVFMFDGGASVGGELSGKWNSYGLAGKIGVQAGGDVHYACLRRFLRDRASGSILQDFFTNLRLPHNVTEVKEIPDQGDVLSLTYGGYLKVGAEASFGYSMSKSADYELGKLDVSSKIDIEARARLALNFALAGNFEVQVRRAREDDSNWARVTVKKARSRLFEFAADLNVGIELNTEGLPDSSDEFLEGLLDIRTANLIDRANAFLEQDPEDWIQMLKEKADGLTQHFTNELTQKWLGKPFDVLDSDEVRSLFERLQGVKEDYDKLGSKVVGFLEKHWEEADVLERSLRILEEATEGLTQSAGLEEITDSKVWDLLRTLVDSEWIDLIESPGNEALEDLKKRVEEIQTVNLERLRDFINTQKQSLNLEPLFDRIKDIGLQVLNLKK